nr:exopolygalacturonase [Quercus suber]
MQEVAIQPCAPANSPNTDGIHVGRSSQITITNVDIVTGDDCISVGDGAQDIIVNQLTCGPGHGISIGSLGRYQNEEPVSGIRVTGATLSNTNNGVRIKTWPASTSGVASDIHFEDVVMNNVANPIIIDQNYCPNSQCSDESPSKVKISNVSFKKIRGTSSTKEAVNLICSKSAPCQQVVLSDIDLAYKGGGGLATSTCVNVQPTISGKQNPPALTCGPGHGISIGSLGRYQNKEPISGIRVTGATLSNIDNGVRIKTWPASTSGVASGIHFKDVVMNNVANPVIIDQNYCPNSQCSDESPSKVKINNVSFKKIRGTSSTKEAMNLICSKSVPCQQVVLSDIDLTYKGGGGSATSTCVNVQPTVSGKQNPPACTNKH